MPRSILQLQREAENLSDERLIQEAQNPQFLPSYLVAQELKRRENDRQIRAEAKAAENTPSTDVFSGLVDRSVAATQQQAQNPFGEMDPQMAAEAMRLMDPRQEQVRDALSGVGSIPNTVSLAGGGIVPEYSSGGMIDPLQQYGTNPDDELIRMAELAVQQAREEVMGQGDQAVKERGLDPENRSFLYSIFPQMAAGMTSQVREARERLRRAQAGELTEEDMLFLRGEQPEPSRYTHAAVTPAGQPQPTSRGSTLALLQGHPSPQVEADTTGVPDLDPDLDVGIAGEFARLRDLNNSGLGGMRTEIPSMDFAPMFADARARAEGLGQMTAEERALSDVERKDAARYRGLIDERQNLEDRRNLALSRASQKILGRDVEGSTFDAITGLRDSQRVRDELLEEKAVALDRARLARTAGVRRDALNKVAEIDNMIAATTASSEAQRVSAQAELDQALRVEELRNRLSIDLAQIRSQSDLERTKVQFAEELQNIAMGSNPDDILKLYELALQDSTIDDQEQKAMILRTLREAALQYFNIALDPVAEGESTQQRSSGSGMG